MTRLCSVVSDQSDCTPTQLIIDKCGVEMIGEGGDPDLQGKHKSFHVMEKSFSGVDDETTLPLIAGVV